jgi:hypothetical protein
MRPTLAAVLLFVAAAGVVGCSGASSYSSRSPAAAATGASATDARASLDGAPFVADRTLPAAALSAERLEAAGTAMLASGGSVSMAHAAAGAGVEAWELVSAAPHGWRVWRPAVVLDALRMAGGSASLLDVTQVDWPDACAGLVESGRACAQIVTPGYRILINAPGRGTIEYHASRVAVIGAVPAS